MRRVRHLGIGAVVALAGLLVLAPTTLSGDERGPSTIEDPSAAASPLVDAAQDEHPSPPGEDPRLQPETLERPLSEEEVERIHERMLPPRALSGPSPTTTYTQVGPGSELGIDIEGAGGSGCTANFVWKDPQGSLYLGTAGHCVLPDDAEGTHGPDASFDPGRVTVAASTSGCLWDFPWFECTWTERAFVELGDLVYARQEIGHDVALVEVPDDVADHHLRTEVPSWGGPEGSENPLLPFLGIVGQGQSWGSTPATEDRLLVPTLLSTSSPAWMAAGPVDFGDSGSPVVNVEPSEDGQLEGEEAVGIATHATPPLGIAWGTKVDQAKWDMACYADLHVHIEPGGTALYPDDCP